MNAETEKAYWHIRNGGAGFYEQNRGLIAVWGKEAVPFLDGMMTNDVKTLSDGGEMLAAFPNAQGRLLALVRILKQGDRFLMDTEKATQELVYQNLFRFTFAGDFFVDDLSDKYLCFHLFNFANSSELADCITFGMLIPNCFVPADHPTGFRKKLASKSVTAVTGECYETLRIERGIPKYGVDMDETTVVPELGLDGLISYTKGCYIGQEIIARIHFRGHVAKQLTGLVLSKPVPAGTELITLEGKPAGRLTSVTYSPSLEKPIALGFVRYDNLARDTKLIAGEAEATVVGLPFEV
jgi:aminomethyltransferase